MTAETEGVVISLILGGASIISSIMFGLVPTMRKQKLEKLKNKNQKLFADVKALCKIESILVKRLAEATGKNEITLKKEVRQDVRDKTGYSLSPYTKPSSTLND